MASMAANADVALSVGDEVQPKGPEGRAEHKRQVDVQSSREGVAAGLTVFGRSRYPSW